MKSEKDIFALFREGGERLNVQPSPKAWEKLDRRLEIRRRESRHLRVHWLHLAAAASVIGIIVLVSFFIVHRISQNQMAFKLNDSKPASLEPLDTSGGCQPYCLLMNERHRLPESYALPVRKAVVF